MFSRLPAALLFRIRVRRPATFSDNLPTRNAFQPNYRAAWREISSLRPCLPDLRELCYSTQYGYGGSDHDLLEGLDISKSKSFHRYDRSNIFSTFARHDCPYSEGAGCGGRRGRSGSSDCSRNNGSSRIPLIPSLVRRTTFGTTRADTLSHLSVNGETTELPCSAKLRRQVRLPTVLAADLPNAPREIAR